MKYKNGKVNCMEGNNSKDVIAHLLSLGYTTGNDYEYTPNDVGIIFFYRSGFFITISKIDFHTRYEGHNFPEYEISTILRKKSSKEIVCINGNNYYIEDIENNNHPIN